MANVLVFQRDSKFKIQLERSKNHVQLIFSQFSVVGTFETLENDSKEQEISARTATSKETSTVALQNTWPDRFASFQQWCDNLSCLISYGPRFTGIL